MVCAVAVLVLGRVIVAVTPLLGVAPLPVTVKLVTATVPEEGLTLLVRDELVACISAEADADSPNASVTVHFDVYVPGFSGAAHSTVCPVPEYAPPLKAQEYVNGEFCGSIAVQVTAAVPC